MNLISSNHHLNAVFQSFENQQKILTLLANALPIVLLLITFFVESHPPITGFSRTGFLDFLPDLVENCDLSKSSLIESINLSNPGWKDSISAFDKTVSGRLSGSSSVVFEVVSSVLEDFLPDDFLDLLAELLRPSEPTR